jgi:hypothetical protein
MFIPDPDLDFLPIPNPGSGSATLLVSVLRIQIDAGSRYARFLLQLRSPSWRPKKK